MSAPGGVVPMVRAGAARPGCTSCARPFGSRVDFCPFCGVAVAPEPVQQPPPIPVLVAPTSRPAPPLPQPAAPIAPAPRTGLNANKKTAAQPNLQRPPFAVGSKPARPLWHWMMAGAAVLLVIFFLTPRRAAVPPTGALTVLVANPAGAAVSTGDVIVDGRRIGPPGQVLTLPLGTVSISFELAGYLSETKYVTVTQGASLRVDLVARPLAGKLRLISSPPSATVSIAGRMLGRTPVNLELAPETHIIILTLDGYLRKTLDLGVEPGETRTLSVDLTQVVPPPTVAPSRPPPMTPVFQSAPFDRGVATGQIPLFAAPSRGSNLLASLPPDTEITVLGQVASEETWLQIRANGVSGFTPYGDGVERWESWARRHVGSGAFESVTPDMRAMIGGNAFPLFGIKQPQLGSSRNLVSQREALRRELTGKTVTCSPKTTTRFVCTIPPDSDLAGYYLLNGVAVAGEGATAYDFEQQEKARVRRKGIWAE